MGTANQRSWHASRHVRHARAVMHVGIANPRWWWKRSRHSRRMLNPQFYVSGKGPLIHKPPKYRDRRFALIYEFIHLKNREAAQRNFLDDHYQNAAYLCQPEAAFIYDDSHVRFILQMPHNRSMAYTVEFLDYQTINTKNGVWTQ